MENFTANLENLNEQEKETLLRLIQKSEGPTEKGLELLKKPLPENPCSTCGMGVACCGCHHGRMYLEQVEPYKKLGVYDIACELRRITEIKRKMEEMQNELDNIKNNLPKKVKDTFDPSCYSDHTDFSGMVERGY